eukprot:TRINITY_DN528_c2_g1_i1.p1 TRINITY_DN528_c2_g1~~TRINITY_DN528_c2_g1_i1.p1  ORF type:complete len:227 (+),score=31.83 TRINITY_DN528_c2_g1_i1:62-682(+)
MQPQSQLKIHAQNALYDNKNVLLKIILLGDSSVGKTTLLNKFVNHKYDEIYKPTIGADFIRKDFKRGDKKITLQIWDTAGQERYESLGSAFYKGADACIFVYDVTSQSSFQRLDWWKTKFTLNYRGSSKRLQTKEQPEPLFIVIGNKIDLIEGDNLISKSALEWCNSNGDLKYFETSAKNGHNIKKAFAYIVEKSLRDMSEDNHQI